MMGTVNSSIHLYYQVGRDPGQVGSWETPTASLMSTKDLFPTPREWMGRTSWVNRWTETDSGGHLLERGQLELVAQEIREFF